MNYDAILALPFAALGVRIEQEQLTSLTFLPPETALDPGRHPLIRQLEEQLDAYRQNPRHRFALPLAPRGSDYRQRVWRALLEIPSGQVLSYGELARRIGSAARAVGQALGDNPLPIIIPCHRVIAADGGLGGFNHNRAGYSLNVKRWLLQHESIL